MGTVTVHAPVEDFAGIVAGVVFDGGVAVVDRANLAAVNYFRRHGYGFDAPAAPPEEGESPDPRFLGDGVVGTRLRDAGVDPRDGDFLEPINAGEANPHGPLVVAPGIHGVAPPPTVPGPVSSDPRQQDFYESDAAQATLMEHQNVGDVAAVQALANPVPPGVVDATDVDQGVTDEATSTETEAPAAADAEAPTDRGVPDGNIDDVLAWVYGTSDPDADYTEGWQGRASDALAVEHTKGDKARRTLVNRLEAITTGSS